LYTALVDHVQINNIRFSFEYRKEAENKRNCVIEIEKEIEIKEVKEEVQEEEEEEEKYEKFEKKKMSF